MSFKRSFCFANMLGAAFQAFSASTKAAGWFARPPGYGSMPDLSKE